MSFNISKKNITTIVGFLALVVLVFGFVFSLSQKTASNEAEAVFVNGHKIFVEVAGTPAQRELGLGGRASLAGDHGMLFVFKDKDKYGFWMKGMNFPLDFVWLDGETVVDITPNVPTWTGLDNPPPIYPNQPVNMVLEVNAGVTSDVGLKIGDKMTLPKNLAK